MAMPPISQEINRYLNKNKHKQLPKLNKGSTEVPNGALKLLWFRFGGEYFQGLLNTEH